MLVRSCYRDLEVTDVAREAGTSPATVYQYCADVEVATLVLAEEMSREAQKLPDLVRKGTWKGRGGYDLALELVDAFIDFWEEHRSVLRVVDLNTEEGD